MSLGVGMVDTENNHQRTGHKLVTGTKARPMRPTDVAS